MIVSEMRLPPTEPFGRSAVDGGALVDEVLAPLKLIDDPNIARAMEIDLRRSISPAAAWNVTL
jgi:hypothetical protein